MTENSYKSPSQINITSLHLISEDNKNKTKG